MSAQPVDQAARDLIGREALDATLFVEAGAGTGKTSQLVERIVNTVLHNDVALADIAAITFTEAAATELQARVRVAFERRRLDPELTEEQLLRCSTALADADAAAISTVHGFARRVLSEFATAAGLPPRVSVLDEVSSQLAHERRWERFVDRLHANEEHEELLYRAALMEVPLDPQYRGHATFKEVAANFAQNWDRLDPLVDAEPPPLDSLRFERFEAAVDALAATAATCADPDDKLYTLMVGELLPQMSGLIAVEDPHDRLRLASGLVKGAGSGGKVWKAGGGGTAKAWGRPGKEVRDEVMAVNEALAADVGEVSNAVVAQLMQLVAREVRNAAEARRSEGGLEFHDLLVLARRMLRRSPGVRAALHERYRHVLLDEFQDTDPIQIEVATLIAAAPADAHPKHWSEHRVVDGHLFFVGDPKQSIYRFRRADIGLFLAARDAFGAQGSSTTLNTNFRTVAPIIEWVNALFGEVMDAEVPGKQPKYEPLHAWREAGPDGDHRPLVFGGVHEDAKVKAGALREAEAGDVAAIVRNIVESPGDWPVFDERTREWRPARLSDVTVLIPTRTSLPFLRDALIEHELPYRLATGTLVYDTQEVRDVLAALSAIDDPNDAISVVAALRSPLYGCSDVDLFEYHQERRTWDLPASLPDGIDADHPVAVGIAHLRSLWEVRWWLSPAELLDRVLRERRAFLTACGTDRPAEVWRRLRFVVDQARAFEEANGGNVRDFLEWASLQSADGARVHEPMLPETDDDALQILTVHGSKGLEFPITILSGMTTQAGGNRGGVSVLWNDDGPPEVKLRSGLSTPEHQPRADLEAEMDAHEKFRLLYVAATRARDHLVVSGHHKATTTPDATFATRVSAFAESVPELCRPMDLRFTPRYEPVEPEQLALLEPPSATSTVSADHVDAERRAWMSQREALLEPLQRTTAMSATAIAATADASIADVDDDTTGVDDGDDGVRAPIMRRKGRAGSSIGRAVHATLEFVDFDHHGDLTALVERQCDLESIGEHVDTVEKLVRSALESDAVELARNNRVYREMYVSTQLGDVMVEGYIDLLIHTADGLVIVDYKTDTATTEAAVDAKVAAYELQGAAYAVALEVATGLSVVDCRFVFCRSGQAIERSVADLASAMQRVRESVSAP